MATALNDTLGSQYAVNGIDFDEITQADVKDKHRNIRDSDLIASLKPRPKRLVPTYIAVFNLEKHPHEICGFIRPCVLHTEADLGRGRTKALERGAAALALAALIVERGSAAAATVSAVAGTAVSAGINLGFGFGFGAFRLGIGA